MTVNEESAASRQFVASAPSLASKWTGRRGYIYLFWGLAAYSTLNFVVAPKLVLGAALVFVLVGLVAYFWWYSRRKILICVTSDGLTVNRRPGDVFSLVDAQLGVWGMGTALHLRCGPHVFVLGGRDHRIANGTSLEARPVDKVDAWLRASDFDELLTTVGHRSRSDARQPAAGEPTPRGEATRCLLLNNPSGRMMLRGERSRPVLALEVGKDAIWVIDPNTSALMASAQLAQVTATPAKYDGPSETERSTPTTAVLVVVVPGLQPLTIGSTTFAGHSSLGLPPRRFSWRGKVRKAKRPAYLVMDADWLTLVEAFGLAPYLEDHANQG
jgi:hypothetical protein